MLPEDAWERRHELAFALEVNRAECEFLTGQLSAADERLAALSNRATTTIELAIVACLHIDVCMTLYQSSRAVAACLDYLRHTGIEWSPHPNEEEVRREYERIESLLGGRTIEELIDLPLMQDPVPLATLEVLSKVTPTAFHTDTNLAVLTICKAVSLSIEHGNCDASCYAYVIFGRIAGPSFGDYKAGFRFGQLGFELVEQRGLTRFEARTYHCFANFVLPWMKHVRACGDLMRRAFEVANRIGDLTYAAYTRNHLNSDLLFAGEQLLEVQGVAEHGLAFAEKARFSLVIDFITPQLALIRTLRGLAKVGEATEIEGPLGAYRLERNDHRKVFVATGTGLAPFLSMFEAIAATQELDNAELYFGCRTPDEDITAAFADKPRHTVACVTRAAPPPGGF